MISQTRHKLHTLLHYSDLWGEFLPCGVIGWRTCRPMCFLSKAVNGTRMRRIVTAKDKYLHSSFQCILMVKALLKQCVHCFATRHLAGILAPHFSLYVEIEVFWRHTCILLAQMCSRQAFKALKLDFHICIFPQSSPAVKESVVSTAYSFIYRRSNVN